MGRSGRVSSRPGGVLPAGMGGSAVAPQAVLRAGRAGRAGVAPSPRWRRSGRGRGRRCHLGAERGGGRGARGAARAARRAKAARAFLLSPGRLSFAVPRLGCCWVTGFVHLGGRRTPARAAPGSSAVGAFVRRFCGHRCEAEQQGGRRDVPRVVGVARSFLILPCLSSPGILDKGCRIRLMFVAR